MMQLRRPLNKVVAASAAYTSTGASSAFSLPLGDTFQILFNVTAVSGTSPTLDLVLQSSPDGGSTYINLPLRSTQVTAAGRIYFVFKLGLGGNEVALESPAASTGGSLAKNCIFDPKYMKFAYTIGGTSPSFTMTVYAGVTQPASQ